MRDFVHPISQSGSGHLLRGSGARVHQHARAEEGHRQIVCKFEGRSWCRHREKGFLHTGPKYEATIATSTANMRITSSGLVNTRFTPVEAASWTASQRDTDELADDHFLLDVTAMRVPGTIDFVALLLAPFFVFKVVEGLTMVLDFPCFGHAACELEVNQLYSCLLGAVHLELDLECLSASIYQCEGRARRPEGHSRGPELKRSLAPVTVGSWATFTRVGRRMPRPSISSSFPSRCTRLALTGPDS